MSINGDRDWTNGSNCGFKSTFILVLDVIACRHCGTDVVFVEVAHKEKAKKSDSKIDRSLRPNRYIL